MINFLNIINNNVSNESIDNNRMQKMKDQDLVNIPKGLIEIEMLQNADFTVEKISENGPSHIAEILGIDVYVGEIIYNATKKASSNVVNSNFFNKLNNPLIN